MCFKTNSNGEFVLMTRVFDSYPFKKINYIFFHMCKNIEKLEQVPFVKQIIQYCKSKRFRQYFYCCGKGFR